MAAETQFPRERELSELIAAPGPCDAGSRAKDKTGELGFVALFTDSEGAYWFRLLARFSHAINGAREPGKCLVDELGEGRATRIARGELRF